MRNRRQKKRRSLRLSIPHENITVNKQSLAKEPNHSSGKAVKASRSGKKGIYDNDNNYVRLVGHRDSNDPLEHCKKVCRHALSTDTRKSTENGSDPSPAVAHTSRHASQMSARNTDRVSSSSQQLMEGSDDVDVICEDVTVLDYDVICVDSDDDRKDDDDDDDDEIKTTLPQNEKDLREMKLCILGLRLELGRMKQEYERKLKMKDDEIQCLKNKLKWKEEQLEEVNKLADVNVEHKSRITSLSSDKKLFGVEMKRKKERNSGIEQKEQEERVKGEKQQKSKQRRQLERHNAKTTEQIETPTNSNADSEKDVIDAYFVEDESDVEFVEEEKVVSRESEEKSEQKQDATKDEGQIHARTSRHSIRKLMTSTKLMSQTKQAAKDEKERIERAKKEHDKHIRIVETNRNNKEPITKQLILAYEEDTKVPLVEVNQKLIQKLKPHQVDAVEFIWDNIIESVHQLKENGEGSGCILAHCMGLGKTLSVITVIHTLLTVKCIGFKHCLIVCPLNTVLNWQHEWEKWLDRKDRVKVFELASCKNNRQRTECLSEWRKTGGVMITGYQLFRILITYSGRSKKTKEIIHKALLNPGPDVVVCDEGHILKNDASAVSKCMNRIRTKRRIILTGTPLQNSLVEYHCMVNFVKPNLLGTRREFNNRFVNPITNGQHSDSTPFDVRLMKRRAHILHSMLDGCVQRRDYSALTEFLPPKYEYVLLIRLSPLQIELYEKYLELFRPEANPSTSRSGTGMNEDYFKMKGTGLFTDYQNLLKIWTHPWLLKLDEARQEHKSYTEYDDELESVLFTSSSEEENECDNELSGDADVISLSAASLISTSEDEESALCKTLSRTVKSQRSIHSKKFAEEADTLDEKERDNLQLDARCQQRKKKVKCSGKRKQAEVDQEDYSDNSKTKRQTMTGKKCKQLESKDKMDIKPDLEKQSEQVCTASTAKLYAGEVIKHWQTQSRKTGNEEELCRKKETPWWSSYVTDEMKNQLELSGKLMIMFEIIHMAEAVGDKVLVFSQSILTLDMIEEFLSLKDQEAKNTKGRKKLNRWEKDEDYCRMDGTTGIHSRKKLTHNFNSLENKRMRLFLISTKAGGLGINLDSANRVIIFNASWNPSHDIQSIFRVYRFGQEKPVFVYRLLAQGTMEEKIYERQVTKETLAQRVIDEHQIDRHFTSNDLQELYHFKPDRLDDPDRKQQPTPTVPKDMILAELLSSQKQWIVQYHEHDSLLENRPDEELSEEERRNAWEEYEREKRGLGTLYRTIPPSCYPSAAELGTSDNRKSTNLNIQIAELPKVVEEIVKYNPTVTADELNRRLQTFLGMNKCYGRLPGFALGHQLTEPKTASQSTASTSKASNSSQVMQATQAGAILPAGLSREQPTSTAYDNLPSRLPLPGPVPANRK